MNKIKTIMLFLCITAITIILSACKGNVSEPIIPSAQFTDGETTAISENADANTIQYYTIDELKQYNGEDGNPMYVAVDGIVYDVTDVSAWFGGNHRGNNAGSDLTKYIKSSPHGTSVLDGLKIVGKLK